MKSLMCFALAAVLSVFMTACCSKPEPKKEAPPAPPKQECKKAGKACASEHEHRCMGSDNTCFSGGDRFGGDYFCNTCKRQPQ